MTPTCFVTRRCMFVMASSCNNDPQHRYSNLLLPWYACLVQKQKAVRFCSSKKSSKKDSPKATNLRRPKSVQNNDLNLNQSVGGDVSTDSKVLSTQSPTDPILPTASQSVRKLLDILPTKQKDVHFTSVYVHPLSQIVLNHFQTHCHDWIRSKRLDRNLTLRQDGTFVLNSSGRQPISIPSDYAASMKTSVILSKNFRFIAPHLEKRRIEGFPIARADAPSFIRIWTTYDSNESKHWLCVSMDESRFSIKYLLQDNSLTPWQGFKLRSVPERVCASVHELMDAVNDYDNYRKQ